MKKLTVLALTALILGVAAPIDAGATPLPCTAPNAGATRFSIPVEGEEATGFYALPTAAPKGLVVFSHGYGHSSFSWQDHLTRTAEAAGVIAVAMDGRGLTFLDTEKRPGIPNTRGWPVSAAAADGLAATQAFESSCAGLETIVNFGVSMGGNTSGLMAAAPATRANGEPLFDWWIDVEGVTNVVSTYLGARAVSPEATEDIEAEMGGPIEDNDEAYQEQAVVLRAGDIAAAGTKAVILVHAVEDGLVGYEQSQYTRAALAEAGVVTQLYSVLSKNDSPDCDTTYTGYVGKPVGAAAGTTYCSPLAGHASELSDSHIVMATAFERLADVFAGASPGCRGEFVVDGQSGLTVEARETGTCGLI